MTYRCHIKHDILRLQIKKRGNYSMNYEIVKLEKKTVVGIENRTGNTDPECQKIIGGLWQKFMGEKVAESVKNKSNDYCIGLYSDYDFKNMTYAVMVGTEVTENENAELEQRVIPAGNYAMFKVTGDVVKDVADAWTEIWNLPLDRSYTADFEEYISNVGGVAQVNIYVALK